MTMGLPTDPYGSWAQATGAVYLADKGLGCRRVALRAADASDALALRGIPGVVIPDVYPPEALFCTAEIDGSDARIWAELHRRAHVLLANPGSAGIDDTPGRPLAPTSAPGAFMHAPKARPVPKVVIGVIDGACGVAHRRFRQRDTGLPTAPWRTRLLGYWDQQREPGTHASWQVPPGLGYGRELRLWAASNGLEALFAKHLPASHHDGDDLRQAFAESRIYDALDIGLPTDGDWTHGTHVLDTAGGLAGEAVPSDETVDEALLPTPRADVDAAGLVFVQLPAQALRDTSGRWMAAFVLDGLRYIVSRAPADASIVVNLSLGAFAGPHDGSSMIELAMDELVKETGDRLTIVVAAGNAGLVRNDSDGVERHCHAQATLAPAGEPGSDAAFPLEVGQADDTESFVEFWLSARPGCAERREGPPAVEAAMSIPADPPASLSAAPGAVANWLAAAGQSPVRAMLVNHTGMADAGPRGTPPMVFAALGHTSRDHSPAPTGTWVVELRNRSAWPVQVEAWVERRDVPGELPGERPQHGFAAAAEGVKLTPHNTLGSLANGQRTVVVEGIEFGSKGQPLRADSSSRVPDLPSCRQPEVGQRLIGAPCEFSAAGFLTGSSKTLKGTSMSSAWVTRLVASRLLALGGPVPLADMLEWLRSGAPPTPGVKPGKPGSPAGAEKPSYVVLLPA